MSPQHLCEKKPPGIGPGRARRGPGSPSETVVISLLPDKGASTLLKGEFHLGLDYDHYGPTAAVAVVGQSQELPLNRLFGPRATLREVYFSTESGASYHLTSGRDPNDRPTALLTDAGSGKRRQLDPAALSSERLINGQGFEYFESGTRNITPPLVEMVAVYDKTPASYSPASSAARAQLQGSDAYLTWRHRSPILANLRYVFLNEMADEDKPQAVPAWASVKAVVAGQKQAGCLLSGAGACDLTELYEACFNARATEIERILFRTASGQICAISRGGDEVIFKKHEQGARQPQIRFTAMDFSENSRRPDGALVLGEPFRAGETALTAPVTEILILEKRKLSSREAEKRRAAGHYSTLPAEIAEKTGDPVGQAPPEQSTLAKAISLLSQRLSSLFT